MSQETNEQAYERGRRDATEELRQFSGVQYSRTGRLTPESIPEHLSYVRYRESILPIVANFRRQIRDYRERVEMLHGKLIDAQHRSDVARQERRENRSGAIGFVRSAGATLDWLVPPGRNEIQNIRAAIRDSEAFCEHREAYLPGLEEELRAVEAWLAQMFEEVAAAQKQLGDGTTTVTSNSVMD